MITASAFLLIYISANQIFPALSLGLTPPPPPPPMLNLEFFLFKSGVNIWAITPEERRKHDQQFDSLTPTLGFVSGEQARKFFLQSGLPAPVLAEIWDLADMTKDGKMNRLEFSIAMKLIKLMLQGQPLPTSLPAIMKQTPTPACSMPSSARFGMGSMPNLSIMPSMPPMPTVLAPIIPLTCSPPLLPMGLPMPLLPSSLSTPSLPNGSVSLLAHSPMAPLGPSSGSGLGKAHSLLDLGSSSSNSSSTTSLTSNSPKTGFGDWAVPQGSRLKYRQHFNSLDKLMSGYVSGPQVRNALTSSNLTQTQLATIWNLADVDRDGQLKAEEFILAMHLVDMAKTGLPLPLSLPPDLVPPSLSAELEKRRQALQEEQRQEEERRRQLEQQEQERRQREALEQEARRRQEMERRMERMREIERQKEEERLKVLERQEVCGSRHHQYESPFMLGNKHKQISDRLRDVQSKRRIQKAELDLINQKRHKHSLNLPQITLSSPLVLAVTTLKNGVCGKDLTCRKLKEQLDVLEKETTAKLSEMEQYNKELKELREKQSKQQSVLDSLVRVKEEKARELQRRRKEEQERRRREEEEEEAVDEATLGEQGWLYGSYQGKLGWIPQSYIEKCPQTEVQTTNTTPESAVSVSPRCVSLTCGNIESCLADTHNLRISNVKDCVNNAGGLVLGSCSLQVKALCSWTAKTETHLNFAKDDIITVLEQQENWWFGELNRSRGWFPRKNIIFCYFCHLEHELLQAKITVRMYTTSSFKITSHKVALQVYEALYTYESPEGDDLTFSAEDTILVTEKDGEWWRGCIGEKTGVFPSNYVKPRDPSVSGEDSRPHIVQVTTANVATTTEQLSLTSGQLILVLAKNSSGWWLGELQARGKKRQKGWFHSSSVKVLGPFCQVIAMYDYKAASEDEMSFSKGQLINVLNKDDTDWWKGELSGVTGLFPTNYVKMTTESDPSQQWCADLMSLDSMSPQERKRQGYIHELIETEERYVEDLELVLEVFHKPMAESSRLTDEEMSMIFVNWRELIMCNTKLLKALRVRKKMVGKRMPVQVIGDILASELSHMQAYIRFCSCQLNGAALLQLRTDQTPDFKDFLKKIATNYRCKGMPLSSFLLKPMQRITRYPLIIKNILENTPEGHVDHGQLQEALERAEELCSQVNEGVREKENSDRLEWIQSHVQCESAIEHLVFNSLTNCLGPRKLLHSGKLHKTKSNKELWAFLFSDFLLLTYTAKQFSSSGSDKLFSPKSNTQYKIYKTPLFLNEVLVKMPSDPSSDEPLFHISHIDRVYTLRTDSINERTTWVQRIKTASEHFIETEKKKREKAYQARSLKCSGIGRLLVTVQEAAELKSSKPNGRSNPYCELTMGAQCYTSRPLTDTMNPKWNFNCQFFIKDIYQDVLCVTIFERDQFSPDDFLGRTEVPVATIKKDQEMKGPSTRRLLLHEVPTGEVWVRLDLQLYDPSQCK
uniref:Intersectin 2a n=1 Tax=Denticeps clupeoides TaxID=299321 RepID=A0AAY4D1R3_9TELE